jgi:hypothetical protein
MHSACTTASLIRASPAPSWTRCCCVKAPAEEDEDLARPQGASGRRLTRHQSATWGLASTHTRLSWGPAAATTYTTCHRGCSAHALTITADLFALALTLLSASAQSAGVPACAQGGSPGDNSLLRSSALSATGALPGRCCRLHSMASISVSGVSERPQLVRLFASFRALEVDSARLACPEPAQKTAGLQNCQTLKQHVVNTARVREGCDIMSACCELSKRGGQRTANAQRRMSISHQRVVPM